MTDAGSIERGAVALDKEIARGNKSKKKRLRKAAARETFNSDGRRVIRHDPGKLPEIVDQVGRALAEFGGNLFTHCGRLVRIYPAPKTIGAGVHRPPGALILHPADGPHTVELATCAAHHERFDARTESYKPCDCPRRVGDAYLSRGYWPELRPLSGFVEAPLITQDARIIERPGYDAETGLFLAHGEIAGYTTPPAKPSKNDADVCLRILLDLIGQFKFVDDGDRSATVAGIITGLLRRILPAAPLMAITAPVPGTGKTLIAETMSIIATGRRPSVVSLGHDDAEAEKRIAGMLLAGDLCIAMDNLVRPLGGDLLCQVTTQLLLRLRPLGGSGMVSVPTHALMIATGNNLSIVGDLNRRTVFIRMDAGVERPERRTFSSDHLEDVFSKRGVLIRAALTIPLAYLAADAPAVDGAYPFGGFEQWDRLVRRPLLWLGLPDPLRAAEGLRDQDPDIEATRLLLSAWCEVFGEKPITLAEVVAAGTSTQMMDSDRTHPGLYDALQLICSEKVHPRRLGYWLRTHRDRIVDGMKIQQDTRDERTKVRRWKVTKCV